ncbi:MAG: AI-2E family transporter [Propionibacterium sp.]|uniref:AI-2E family transporter n=1 Tax=Propionibacterium freudenreichii TaxID=1744 RepID=UPI0021A2DCAE|nr:AI-2E family transporter [Propionibacterium freudenreichii]MDK9651373.1 AI-2E family transporter [Propionibacterium freudenreichii]MDK9664781.1 AI-2E family transporter [Propionibacterium freudenreichii]MDN6797770.1 AI-2E family transporter [Propionibacterium sp.]WFF31589.1 AI-2E family transporter [Propionibacterium freudenreichii]
MQSDQDQFGTAGTSSQDDTGRTSPDVGGAATARAEDRPKKDGSSGATRSTSVAQGPFRGQPRWLPRMSVIFIAMIGIAGSIWLFRQLSWLLAPVFLGLNLVIAFYPIYSGLTRRKWPRALAAIVMALALLSVVILAVASMAWAVGTLIGAIPSYVPRIQAMYGDLMQFLVQHHISADAVSGFYSRIDPNNVLSALTGVLGSISGSIGAGTVALTTILMLLVDSVGWKRRLGMVEVGHPRAIGAIRDFAHGTRRYWLVSMVFGAIMAGLNAIELKILNVPLMGVWVVLTFITTFIPSVGFFFAMVPPVIVALVVNGWQNALWLMAIYFVTTWIVQGFFQPKFTGNAVGVNITTSFISLLFWAWVFGPLGALIALPATQLVKSLVLDADPKSRWVSALIAPEPSVVGADPQT